MSAAQASSSTAAGSVSHDEVKSTPYDDSIVYEIKYLERLLRVLARRVHNQPDQNRRRSLYYKISVTSHRLRRLSSLSKDQKPTYEHDKEFKGTSETSTEAEGTTLLKPVPYFGIDKDDGAEIDDRLKRNKERCRECAWVREVKKSERYPGIAKGRKIIKEMRGLYFPLSKGLIFPRGLQSKRRQLFKWHCLSKRQHSKPAPPELVVHPKRRRSPSPQDSYTSLEDDSESTGISEDSSDAEGTSLPEVQSSTSEDGSDVEDPDVKDVDDFTNVEDSANVGEVEYSSDCEYSSDGTTLLKPAPYIEILSDEDPETKKAIERHMKFCEHPCPESSYCVDFIRFVSGNSGKCHFIAGPVLQVIAVHITNPTSKELKIHGHISVTDDKYNTYYIYNRLSECPEKVSPGHEFLPLNSWPLLPLMCGNVEFSLKHGSDLIFERKVTVEYLPKYEDGHVRKLRFGGKDNCRATMFFTVIPYAHIAEFRMNLWEPLPPTTGGAFRLHGKIKVNNALCFKKTPEEPVEMWQGAYNHIGQFVLAASVFSPLLLYVKLYRDGKKLAYQVYRELFYNYRSREMKYECYDKKYELNVALQWISFSDYFEGKQWSSGLCPQINKPTYCPAVVYENEKSDYDIPASVQINQPTNYPTVAYENDKCDYDLSSSVQLNLEPTAVTSDDGPLVEIFSILVGGGNSSVPLALCGTIVVRDGGGTFYIFSRHPDCLDMLSSSNKLQQSRTSLSLAWPWRCVVEKKLFIHFKLENAHGQKVCRGSLRWCERELVSSGPFDTRICAIIPGENGYFTAVHFSVFKNGLKAKLTVVCSSSKDGLNYNSDDQISVYGSVFAEYSNYNYPSTYDKEYYRSIIFKRTKEYAVKVKNGSKIPLSKSMVSAPSDCEGIIADVDLLVISSGEQRRVGRAFGRIRFKANKNGVCEMRLRDCDGGEGWMCEDCRIKVMLVWVRE